MKKNTRNLIVVVLAFVIVLSAVVFTSCKKNETYTVTFNSNGGTAVDSITDIAKNSTITEPAAPVKEGYIFGGWFTSDKLTKKWTFATDKVKSDMTLYAKWDYNATSGLELLLNKTTYTVVGVGSATGDIVIPSEYNNLAVTAIAVGAFENVNSITSVFVPESVTTINDSAFSNCANLTRVALPSNLTEIKPKTFYSCVNLTEVNFPSNVTKIGEEAFFECKKLASVNFPSSLSSIDDKAFSSCESLTSVNLPASLRTLGENVFSGCIGIETLTAQSSNFFYSEGNCIIYRDSGEQGQTVNTLVVGCKNSVIPTNVTVIGKGAFYGCRTLDKTISIPMGVTAIQDYAFASCYGLTSVIVPASVVSVGEGAFTGCLSLRTVTFGSENALSNLQRIGREAFSHCTELGAFIIPQSVTFIGAGVFYNDPGITSVDYLGTTDDFKKVTIGTVEEGEENYYTGRVTVKCQNASNYIVGLK